jgi:hypothetical protein
MVHDLKSKDHETAYAPSSVRFVAEHDLLFGFAARIGGVDDPRIWVNDPAPDGSSMNRYRPTHCISSPSLQATLRRGLATASTVACSSLSQNLTIFGF